MVVTVNSLKHLRKKYYHHQGLKDAGVVIPTTSPFNLSTWPVQESNGSQRMTVDYCKFNQVLTQIAAALPDVVSLFEQINTSLVPDIQLLIWQMPFSQNLLVKTPRSSLFSAGKASNTLLLSYLRGISTLWLYTILQSTDTFITSLYQKTSQWPYYGPPSFYVIDLSFPS